TQIAAEHERGHARDIGLESHGDQVVHDSEMGIIVCRYAEWDLKGCPRSFRIAGDVLDSPFDLTNILEVRVELGTIASRDAFLDTCDLVCNGIEDAACPLAIYNTFLSARAVRSEEHTSELQSPDH